MCAEVMTVLLEVLFVITALMLVIYLLYLIVIKSGACLVYVMFTRITCKNTLKYQWAP